MARKANGSKTTTKAEAVRQALAAGKVMPLEGVAYIRETFGIEMKPQQFSTAKNTEKMRAKKGRRKPGPKPNEGSTSSTTGHRIAGSSQGGFVEHAEAIKRAVQSLGAGQVKRLVGLFE